MQKLILKKIAYKNLRLTGANIRDLRNLSPEDSQKMIANIEANNGIDTPLLVRPSDGKYEIVQGQRRYWAFKNLKENNLIQVNELPCLVGNFSDSEIQQMGINEAATTVLIPFRDLAQAIRTLKAKDYPDYESKAFARIIGLSEELVEESLTLEKQFEQFSDNLSHAPAKVESYKVTLRYMECPFCRKKIKHYCRN